MSAKLRETRKACFSHKKERRCEYSHRPFSLLIILVLSLNGNIFLFFHSRFCFFLRNGQSQDTIFKTAFDVILSNAISDIETTLVRAIVTFFTDIFSIFAFFVLVVLVFGIDDEISVFQLSLCLLYTSPSPRD